MNYIHKTNSWKISIISTKSRQMDNNIKIELIILYSEIFMSHNTKYIVIQNTWNEDDDQDLIEYCKKYNNVKTLSDDEILKMDVSLIEVLFADTSIIQKKVKSKFVPKCYPEIFNKLYKRKIKQLHMKDISKLNYPFFVKPYDNDKSYEAHIVKNNYDMDSLKQDLHEHHVKYDDYVYHSELVNFVNEYRLFIGNRTLIGMVDSTDMLIDPSRAVNDKPPQDFIDEVLNTNNLEFCVIDIGLGLTSGSTDYQWMIVEINPSFALTSYDWDIKKYFDYCKQAWNYFQSTI